ncbi:MAG: hypothetical protein CL489_05215 [Acidobacteria bacterium]|nr:hypothetical protein [Acidobacteriota bacterium]
MAKDHRLPKETVEKAEQYQWIRALDQSTEAQKSLLGLLKIEPGLQRQDEAQIQLGDAQQVLVPK